MMNDSERETPSFKYTEEEFRDYINEFFRHQHKGWTEDQLLTNFMVITTAQSIQASDTSYTGSWCSSGFPLAYQVGCLEYVISRMKARITVDICEDEDEDED